jgi:Flp pilus assembly protein TadG
MRSRRGHAHLEFALVLPVLLLIIYGIMEYGWMFFQRTAVQEAARVGCRRGATVSPNLDYAAVVEQATLAAFDRLGVDCDRALCTVTTEALGEEPRLQLQCTVSVVYVPLLTIVPTPERLSSGFQYYFEQQ